MDEDYLSFNGADGATGRYLLPPMPLHSFAQAILGETFARDSVRRAVGPAASWPYSTSGWSSARSEDLARAPGDSAHDPLRPTQWSRGYVAGKTKRQFLADFGMARQDEAVIGVALRQMDDAPFGGLLLKKARRPRVPADCPDRRPPPLEVERQ